MFVRLFSSILDSSLMEAEIETRWLFVTMLIVADEAGTGVVDMPISRLAARAAMSEDQTRRALGKLMEPDPLSASKEEEGRRIRLLDSSQPERGWVIVNWDRYRVIAKEEARRAQVLQAVHRYRHNKARSVIKRNRAQSKRKPDVIKSNTSDSDSNSNSNSNSDSVVRDSDAPGAGNGSEGKKIPPTYQDVVTYAAEKNQPARVALKFHAHYTSNGWKVGKNPMKNWKAAFVNWITAQ